MTSSAVQKRFALVRLRRWIDEHGVDSLPHELKPLYEEFYERTLPLYGYEEQGTRGLDDRQLDKSIQRRYQAYAEMLESDVVALEDLVELVSADVEQQLEVESELPMAPPPAEVVQQLAGELLEESIEALSSLGNPAALPLREVERAPEAPSPQQLWAEGAEQDRRVNVLYLDFLEQALGDKRGELELEEYSELLAARALLRLLAYVPNCRERLSELFNVDPGLDWAAMRFAAISAIESGLLEESDSEEFLSRLFFSIPGSRKCLYRLLAAYKRVVICSAQAHLDDIPGELPGAELAPVTYDQLVRLLGRVEETPFEKQLRETAAMDMAMARIAHDGIPLRLAAEQFGLSRSRLHRELKRRGLSAAGSRYV